jgi:hypothetical protein
MLDTGFPQADAENDFLRARRRHVLATLAHRLRGQPADRDRLLPLDQVTGALGWRGERQLGLHTIRLDTIVGTVESRRDFDRHFRPTSNRVRYRWEQLALAERRGVAIPPIEVYRVGSQHFVHDGHHRVSIAAATGQQIIDAYVTEILTAVPPSHAARVTAPRDHPRADATPGSFRPESTQPGQPPHIEKRAAMAVPALVAVVWAGHWAMDEPRAEAESAGFRASGSYPGPGSTQNSLPSGSVMAMRCG